MRTLRNAFAVGPDRPRLHAHRHPRRRQDHHRPHHRPRAELHRPGRHRRPDRRALRRVPRLRRDPGRPPPRRDRDGRRLQHRHGRRARDASRRRASGPIQARIKVFIIDEVHMLSRNAFNALLKTLEEPPPHVKFVFATTELRKVPVTVLSRCQRFDLRRVPAADAGRAFRPHRRAGGGRGRAGGARPDRARRRRLGARRALAARPGDRPGRGGRQSTGTRCRHMLGLGRPRHGVRAVRGGCCRRCRAEALDRSPSELHERGADPARSLQDLLESATPSPG